MIPKFDNGAADNVKAVISQPCYTYALSDGHIRGFVDGEAAVEQAVRKILSTERFINGIYSWNYGFESGGLIGEDIGYVAAEVQRLISEALLQDDRIREVDNFSFQKDRNTLRVSFTVHSTFGELRTEREFYI